MSKSLADTRAEYGKSGLNKEDLLQDPISQFERWYQEVVSLEKLDPNAFVLSTAGTDNHPDARVLLLKGIEEGDFIFYTNYDSPKAMQIEQNSWVSMLFFWKALEKQVRIKGTATKLSEQKSTEYFNSRPRGSQLGAWASHQSEVLDSREILEDSYKSLETQYQNLDIPKPKNWGGFKVTPTEVEFWQGRASRLHDRFLYSQEGDDWKIQRLSP